MKLLILFVFLIISYQCNADNIYTNIDEGEKILNVKSIFENAKNLINTKKYFKAREKLIELTTKYPTSDFYIDSLLMLANTNSKIIDILKNKAIDQYKNYILLNPENSETGKILSKLFSLLENESEKTLKIISDMSSSIEMQRFPEIFLQYAETLEKTGNYKQSAEFYNDDLKMNLHEGHADKTMFKLARLYENYLNNPDMASYYYKQIIENYPLSSYYELSKKSSNALVTKLKNYKSAIENIVDSDTDDPRSLMNLGDIYSQKENNYSKAIETYKKIIENDPYSEEAKKAQLKIADSYEKNKNYSNALKSYKNYLKENPDGDDADKIKYKMAKIYQNDENAYIINSNGSYIRNYQNINKSMKTYENIINNDPNGDYAPKAQLSIGKLYVKDIKDVNKAKESLQKVIDNYPWSDEAEEARKLLNNL